MLTFALDVCPQGPIRTHFHRHEIELLILQDVECAANVLVLFDRLESRDFAVQQVPLDRRINVDQPDGFDSNWHHVLVPEA